ncbi:MAG: Sec-independent protein translocase subunit TatA/TatB [Phycisphaerae bacterium]
MTHLLAVWLPGGTEMVVILVVALLIFGRRLPEVARSMGKSIVEFKRGLNDVKDEIDKASTPSDPKQLSEQSNHDPAQSPASQPAAAQGTVGKAE